MVDRTIVIVIMGHGEIPIEIVSESETATRPTPKQKRKALASTIPVETIIPLTRNMNELSELTPDNKLNVVKYSYTEPGNCSIGTIDRFYQQFDIISKSGPLFNELSSLEDKMNQIKFILNKEFIKSSKKKKNDLSSISDVIGLDQYTKGIARAEGIKTGYDPIGTNTSDVVHSLDRSGNITTLSDNFIDKNYIFKQDTILTDTNASLGNTFYKYGVYCAYTNRGPLHSPFVMDTQIYPYDTELSELRLKKFTVIEENTGDLYLSTIIEMLINIGYNNIGIFDFTCSNFKPIDAEHLGYNPKDRTDKTLRDLRALTRESTSMAEMNEPRPTKRTATSMEDMNEPIPATIMEDMNEPIQATIMEDMDDSRPATIMEDMDDSRPATIMEDMDDSRPTKRAGGRRKTRKNRRKHKKTEKPNKKSNKKSIAFTP